MKQSEVTERLTLQRERLDSTKVAIGKLPRSRGQALAFTSLEKGRMYVGELCRELGKAYPYEATKKATTAEGIQEAVDLSTKEIHLGDNEISNLNFLRDDIEVETKVLLDSIREIQAPNDRMDQFVMNTKASEAYRGLLEARMWLGIRLGELRDLNK